MDGRTTTPGASAAPIPSPAAPRGTGLRAAAAATLLVLSSCRTSAPTPQDWQRIGFRTPEQTFHTFLTAFATDQLDLEYRCLSDAFKARNDLDGLGYRLLRDQLAEEIPGFDYLARAETRARIDLGPERVGLVAQVEVLWFEGWFLVELVQEEFFMVRADGERVLDGFASFDRSVVLADAAGGEPARLWASVALDDPLGEPLPPIEELSEIQVAREWKLDDLSALTPGDAASYLDAPADEPQP